MKNTITEALNNLLDEAAVDNAEVLADYQKLLKKSKDKNIAGKALAHDYKFRAVKVSTSGKLKKVQTRSGKWIDVTKTPKQDEE